MARAANWANIMLRSSIRHDWDYKDSIRRQFVEIYGLDLLIINHVEIEPTLRKRGLGLLMVSKTIDVFGENFGLIAMKPFPLQFRNYLDPGWLPPDGVGDPKAAFLVATKKLRNYWGRAGFKRVNGTDFCALSPACKRPGLKRIRSALDEWNLEAGQGPTIQLPCSR